MIYAVGILSLMAFSIGVFFISNFIALGAIGFAFLIVIIVSRKCFARLIKISVLVLPFMALNFLFNWLVNRDLYAAVIMVSQVYLVVMAGVIFTRWVGAMQFAKGLFFLTRSRNIAVTVAVAVAFLPVLRAEYLQIRQSMRAKGRRRGVRIVFRVILFKILFRAANLSLTLDSKGFR